MTITTIEFKNQFINQFSLETFHQAIKTIRTKARSQGLCAHEHVLYNILRDLPLDRGFGLIKNPVKLANGQWETQGFDRAKGHLKYVFTTRYNNQSEEFLKSLGLPVESKEYFLSKI